MSPSQPVELDLSACFTGQMLDEMELIKLVFALGDDVTHIDLSSNNPKEYSTDVLQQILHALPPTVTHIAIEKNKFISLESYKALQEIHYDDHLKVIRDKLVSCSPEGKEYKTGAQLLERLETYKAAFLLSPKPMDEKSGNLNALCKAALDDATPVLASKPGWGKVFTDFVKSLFGVAKPGKDIQEQGTFKSEEFKKELDKLLEMAKSAESKTNPGPQVNPK